MWQQIKFWIFWILILEHKIMVPTNCILTLIIPRQAQFDLPTQKYRSLWICLNELKCLQSFLFFFFAVNLNIRFPYQATFDKLTLGPRYRWHGTSKGSLYQQTNGIESICYLTWLRGFLPGISQFLWVYASFNQV